MEHIPVTSTAMVMLFLKTRIFRELKTFDLWNVHDFILILLLRDKN